MMNRFRAVDRRNLEIFQGIVSVVGNHIPLDFIFKVFQHMRTNPEFYNHQWLYNALRTTQELSELRCLEDGDMHVMYATTMLMEGGRRYDNLLTNNASEAFAIVFLNSNNEDDFFPDEEIQAIFKACKRSTVNNLRPSVDTLTMTVANEVRLLTDVFFPNPAKMVVEFVRGNSTPNSQPLDPDEWRQELAENFALKFGRRGSVWQTLPNMILHNKQEQIRNFQHIAEDRIIISSLVEDNYKRIFARR